MTYRGQVSVEFLIVLSIVLIIFLSFFTVIDSKNQRMEQKEVESRVKGLAENVGTTINEVHLGGNGFRAELYVAIDEKQALRVYGERAFIEVTYEGGRHIFPILTSNIQNKNITQGELAIKNVEGEIVFS